MSPKAHTKKVMAKATKEKHDSKFRCANCGKTFKSEAERKAHETKQHAQELKQRPR